jgi:integrase/recombinase XerD
MALSKEAKVLTAKQVQNILKGLSDGRNAIRNRVIFLLSFKAGLRAKEISSLTWSMLLTSDGKLSDSISLTNHASKGKSSGREIPIHPMLKNALQELFDASNPSAGEYVIKTERSDRTSPQVIVNFFQTIYRNYGIEGASSHSGRRTFITGIARKISSVGGSLNDVRALAGHSSLQTTMRYIDENQEAKKSVINLI